jgi:TRAP-type uncharacterized transport system fused permease subunit
MGVLPISAHLFALYFAVISNITPPVAISSYAAAGIAEADAMKTSIEAVKLGIVAFIVPFMFVFNPSLLMIGSFFEVLTVIISSLIGIVALAGGLQNFFIIKTNIIERILLIVGAVSLIFPGIKSDLFGLSLLAIAVILQLNRRKKNLKPAI